MGATRKDFRSINCADKVDSRATPAHPALEKRGDFLARQMSATRPIHVDRLRSLFPESDILTERLLGLPNEIKHRLPITEYSSATPSASNSLNHALAESLSAKTSRCGSASRRVRRSSSP